MRFSVHRFGFLRALVLTGVLAGQTLAQGYDQPLTIQGLDRSTLHSAASRAAGGLNFGLSNHLGIMFSNPAALHGIDGIQLSLAGEQSSLRSSQEQHYTPLKYYSNFSLLMEGLTGYIPDPNGTGINAGDTVQRPFDSIGPNWSRSKSHSSPLHGLAGIPFSMGERKVAIGVGIVEYADISSYHQNNNILNPAIGAERPFPIPRPSNDSVPVVAQWSQFSRVRDGVIRGYGAALSAAITDEFSVGISGMVLSGSSDDFEQQTGRGKLTFFANYFRLDSVRRSTTVTGTSNYSGSEFTLSAQYAFRYLMIGFSLKPPTTITREFTRQTTVDTTGTPVITSASGEERVRLPWRGTAAVSVVAMENLRFGLEYELRSYASATHTQANGVVVNPWFSTSLLRAGVEYAPASWLVLRAGIRGQAEGFEPEGNPIEGEPVTYSIYSAGFGLFLQGVRLNVAYEYAPMKYQDVWQTNVNLNSQTRHGFLADISYEIPWSR